jgi:putative oxygen-independent coproporphyrinogen III oxidase
VTLVDAPVTVADGRSGRWREQPEFGVYVHIPFCLRRCHYCDFNTYEGQEGLHAAYVDALVEHIDSSVVDAPPATSVFFGGGTPTLLASSQLARVLAAIGRAVGIEADAEITVEANPETVDRASFERLLAAGFNRFSVGVQSLAPHVLDGLGRTHSGERAADVLADARRAGVTDLNADLIYGSPWERASDWAATLQQTTEAGPDHVSAYALTIEEATPLATLVATGRVPDVDPDVQADRFGVAQELLAGAGYQRYEVSNWARPGRASRHNVLYWCAGDYLGFGAGAHGHISGRRFWSLARPRDFVAAVQRGASVEAGNERLDPVRRAAEAAVLGLRLSSGIDLDGLARRPGICLTDGLRDAIEDLVGTGLLERRGSWVRIPERAVLLGGEVARRLV